MACFGPKKQHHFIHDHLLLQNYFLIGFVLIIEAYGVFAMEFCLIMKVLEEGTFVTRKITWVTNIALGLEECLYLGNISSLRDWGSKGLCKNAMDDASARKPKDYVLENNICPRIYSMNKALGIELELWVKDR